MSYLFYCTHIIQLCHCIKSMSGVLGVYNFDHTVKYSEVHPTDYYTDMNILEDLEKWVKQQGDLAATKRK